MSRKTVVRVATVAVVLMFLLAAASSVVAVSKATGPTVTAAGLTRDANDLDSAPRPWVSGLFNNTFYASYVESTTVMREEATLHFQYSAPLPGRTLSQLSNSMVLPRIVPGDGQSPTATHYEGDYNPSEPPEGFPSVADGTVVYWGIRACETSVPDDNCLNDDNNGAWYQHRLDVSKPEIDDFTIPFNQGLGKNVTGRDVDEATNPLVIQFDVEDDTGGAPMPDLDGTAVEYTIDGVPKGFCGGSTTADCFQVTQNTVFYDYTVEYKPAVQNGQPVGLGTGSHSIVIAGADQAGHAIPVIFFEIDKQAPTVPAGEITSIPPDDQSIEQPDGTYITSQGVQVNVTAQVTDPQGNVDTAPPATASCSGTTPTYPVCGRFVDAADDTTFSPWFKLTFNEEEAWWENTAAEIEGLPEEDLSLVVEIRARDVPGNTATSAQPDPVLIIDPSDPVIDDGNPTNFFIPVGPLEIEATITDDNSGVVAQNVTIWFKLNSGTWAGGEPNLTKNAQGYFFDHMTDAAGDTFVYTIPEANDTSVIKYFITAPDLAGNNGTVPERTVTVDGTGPVLAEEPRALFRGPQPFDFEVEITDDGSGVSAGNATVFYRAGGSGSFAEADLSPSTEDPDLWAASVSGLNLNEGGVLQYHYQASDEAGNLGNLGTAGEPLRSIIDLTPPEFSLTAPSSASGPTFDISWSASDPRISASQAGSGVGSYTIFARVQGTATWVPVLQNTTDTSTTVCAEAGRTYEFTGFATDTVGNSGDRSESALGTTALTGESCAERLIVNVLAPNTAGASFNAQGGEGTLEVRWSATTTRLLSPNDQHDIDILFSPDNGVNFYEVASDVSNAAGTHQLPMELPTCSQCFIKVRATSVEGVVGEDTGAVFQITNGDTQVDLDGNGLPDTWEMQYAGRLGITNPNVDLDGDGLTNRREAQAGTDPANRDTDGDSFSDGLEVRVGTDPLDPQSVPTEEQARVEQWTMWYWSVPIMFAVVAVIFFIGLARRW